MLNIFMSNTKILYGTTKIIKSIIINTIFFLILNMSIYYVFYLTSDI